MASALSAPVGFKNAIQGTVGTAIDAIHVSAQAHRFPTISLEGRATVITTTGNPDGHLVLRGTGNGPNFDAASVQAATLALQAADLPMRLVIDCSHGNSSKDHTRQSLVAADIARQLAGGGDSICGVMLESHLQAGRQDIVTGLAGLNYGQSVTDACIGWDTTVDVLQELANGVKARRAARQ
jgi:3-deoxy-7-phosphoheptulonate synthase